MAAQSPLAGRPRRPPLDAVLTVRRAVRLFLSEPEVSAWLGSGQVFVAVSGGADSLALAEAAAHVGRRRGLTVGALVVDHGLQAGSAEVAEWAAQTALRLGVDTAKVLPVTVSGGGGPEAAARRARYAALREHAGDDALVLFGTPATTRPRPCCSDSAGGPGHGRWPVCVRSTRRGGGRCWTCPGPSPRRRARNSG